MKNPITGKTFLIYFIYETLIALMSVLRRNVWTGLLAENLINYNRIEQRPLKKRTKRRRFSS